MSVSCKLCDEAIETNQRINNNACFGSTDMLAIWILVALSPLETINN